MNKWVINKIGLINFWYYDEEEFEFSDGRLLLRGANGSGKSVTMQSFIPLLLDGNRSAKRLDPFGTNSRRIENYLLPDGDTRDENTGYLYMEFRKPETDVYITIGIGLRARRGKSVDFWGFSITDGKRIGRDFKLYKEIGDKIPLTKRELKNRILENGIGEFCEKASDYKEMVNRHIFGFYDIAEYDQLIDLLVQLRSPKLSKDYKPTVLYEIMEDSLKPLSDEDLRPMSEAIENMDAIEASITELKNVFESSKRLKTSYDKYNLAVLGSKAKDLIRVKKSLDDAEKKIYDTKCEIDTRTSTANELSSRAESLSLRRSELEDKLRRYKETDTFRISEDLRRLSTEAEAVSAKIASKQSDAERYSGQLSRERLILADKKKTSDNCRADADSKLSDMGSYAADAAFSEHEYFAEEAGTYSEGFDFFYIKSSVTAYTSKLAKALAAFNSLEEAEREYDRLTEQHAAEKSKYDSALSELRRAENLFNTEKSTLIEKTYDANMKNRLFKLSETQLQAFSQYVYSADDFSGIDPIKAITAEAYNEYRSEINAKIKLRKQSLDDVDRQMNELLSEISALEAQKEIEPPLTAEQELFRKTLSESSIPFVPLYRACDLKDEVTEEMARTIEEALDGMGLLNALIIPKGCSVPRTDGAGDRIIYAGEGKAENNLLSFLRAETDTSVPEDEIKTILAQISSENGGLFINENGEYGISILKGFTGNRRGPEYIGAQARKRRKERIIAELREKYDALSDEYNRIGDEINALEADLRTLADEYGSLPSCSDLSEALSLLKNAGILEQKLAESLEKLTDAVKRSFDKTRECRKILDERCDGIALNRSKDVFEDAHAYMDDYRDTLTDFIELYKDIRSLDNEISYISDRTSLLETRIDELYAELRDLKHALGECLARKKNCEEVLARAGFKETQAEMLAMSSELDAIPSQLEEFSKLIGRNESETEHLKRSLAEANEALEPMKAEKEYAENAFSEELDLGYVKISSDKLYRAADEAAAKASASQLTELRDELSRKYYSERTLLTDYSVTDEQCFEESAPPGFTPRRRLRLTALVRGAKTDFYEFIEYIEREIASNEELLTEKDRELFEDLLIDTVGRKMRAKISYSERWVTDMNKKMMSMDTSSGLSFSLEWKSRPAENEDEMNTAELVSLLKTDSRILTDENIAKMSKHFRSKLNTARLRHNDGGDAESMHTILKEILDYRKWFEFKLFYRQTGQPKKELTNNAFYRFSGGEKAMAMYVPLFASVYARYAKADEFAPKLISLDEAFAGVDDKNISDMFRIMEELELSYIINSQVLWGDYPTVPSLSICELVRPNNADYVTVLRYRWDGKERSFAP